MRGEDLLQGFRQVLQEMETVRDLRGVGRALACTLGIRARPIPRDDLHPGMLPQPLRDGLGGTIREEFHGLAACEIHQDRAIRMPFPQRKIVHPSTLGVATPGQAGGGARATGCGA